MTFQLGSPVPPGQSRRLRVGLFDTQQINPAAGGPGEGPPPALSDDIDWANLNQPQQRARPMGGGGFPGGVEGGRAGGLVGPGMGGTPVTGLGGTGTGFGPGVPGTGAGGGGTSVTSRAGIQVREDGVWQLTVAMGVPTLLLRKADVGTIPTGSDTDVMRGIAQGKESRAQPAGDDRKWTDVRRTHPEQPSQVSSMTAEDHAWLNGNLGTLLLALSKTSVEGEKGNVSEPMRLLIGSMKDLLDALKRNSRLYWGRGGGYQDPETGYLPNPETRGSTLSPLDRDSFAEIILSWVYRYEGWPGPCTPEFVRLLGTLVNELQTAGDPRIRQAGVDRRTLEHASNLATRYVLRALGTALRQAEAYPENPGTEAIRDWIEAHPGCKSSIEGGSVFAAIELESAERVKQAERLEVGEPPGTTK